MPQEKLTPTYINSIQNPSKRLEISDSNTAGLFLRITTNGSKSFVYRYRFGKKVKRYTIGKYPSVSLANARKEARELAYVVSKGNDPIALKQQRKKESQVTSFTELATAFKDIHLKSLRAKTRTEHSRIIDNELIPQFGAIAAKELTKEAVIEFLDKKAITDKRPTMANRIRARLHSIYEFGVHRALTDSNPVSGIKAYSEGETKRDRFYSEDEIRQIWHAIDQVNEPSASIIRLLLITGQRKSETMNMKWEHIQGNVWTIPAELAKGKRKHHVPLSKLAMQIIDDRRTSQNDSLFVFPSPITPEVPIQEIKRAVSAIRNITGIEDFRLHDLRRTAATHMAEMKVDRTTLGKILNHKGLAGDGQVTAIYDRYDYMDEKRLALDAWSSRLSTICAHKPN